MSENATTSTQVRIDMDKGDRVEVDSASARGRSQKRSSVVAGPEEAGSGGEHVKCALTLLITYWVRK